MRRIRMDHIKAGLIIPHAPSPLVKVNGEWKTHPHASIKPLNPKG